MFPGMLLLEKALYKHDLRERFLCIQNVLPLLILEFEAVALLWFLKSELISGKIMTQGPEIHVFLTSQ